MPPAELHQPASPADASAADADDRSDPRRWPRLAVRSILLLGGLSAAFGLAFVITNGYLNPYTLYRRHFIAMGLAVWFLPGLAFVGCALLIRRGSRGAALAAIATAGVQGLMALGLLVASVMFPPVSALPIVLGVLWVAALVQIIIYLRRSLSVIRVDVALRPGFELTQAAAHAPARTPAPRPVLPVDQATAEESRSE
jgi:hypothetical protein